MNSLYEIRAMDPKSSREVETVTCFAVMTIWESRPELLVDPRKSPGYSWEQTNKRLVAGLRNADNRYLVATDGDGHLVGSSISVIRHAEDGRPFGYFWSRYILPRARRQGLATRFLVDAENWFRSKRAAYAEVHIHTENQGLRGLFQKRGYKVADRGRDAIWSWIVLRKDL